MLTFDHRACQLFVCTAVHVYMDSNVYIYICTDAGVSGHINICVLKCIYACEGIDLYAQLEAELCNCQRASEII